LEKEVNEEYVEKFIDVFMSCLEPCWKDNGGDKEMIFIRIRGISRLVVKQIDLILSNSF
jgi:hypothetical protein